MNNNFVKIIPFIFIGIFSGVRYKVGVDYLSYIRINNIINQGINTYTEPGYEFLVRTISLFNGNYQLVFLIIALFTNILAGIFIIKFSKSYFLSSLMYFCFPLYYLSTFNQIRQYLAIYLFSLSLIFIIEKKFYKFTIIVMFAFLFHRSVIFLIPLYFFLNKKYSNKNYLFMFIGYLISIEIFIKLVSLTRYSRYLEFTSEEISITLYVFLLINLLILFSRKYIGGFDYSHIFINLAFISSLLIVSTLIIKDIPNFIFLRMNNYFMITYLILVGYFLKILTGKYQQYLYTMVGTYFFVSYFVYTLVSKGELYKLIPYQYNFNFFIK